MIGLAVQAAAEQGHLRGPTEPTGVADLAAASAFPSAPAVATRTRTHGHGHHRATSPTASQQARVASSPPSKATGAAAASSTRRAFGRVSPLSRSIILIFDSDSADWLASSHARCGASRASHSTRMSSGSHIFVASGSSLTFSVAFQAEVRTRGRSASDRCGTSLLSTSTRDPLAARGPVG
jgi:hypothetical protein